MLLRALALMLVLTAAGCGPSSPGPSAPTAAAPASPAAKPVASPAAAAAASPSAVAAAVPSGPLKQLKVGTLPTLGNAPFIIAQQRGYFAAEGIDVELMTFGSGAEIVAPLGTGQIDAGNSITPSAGLVNAVARGVAIKIVASNGTIKPNRNIADIVVRKALQPGAEPVDRATLNRPIRAAAAAEGLVPHAILLREAEKAGLAISDVNMTYLALPDINAAMASSQLDVAASGEPLITIGVQQGLYSRWKRMADLYPDMPYSNLLYGPNLLEKDRDAGERLMRAYLRGVRDYEDAFSRGKDRDTVVAMLADPLRTPAPLFQAMQDQGGLAFIDPDGAVSTDPLKPILDEWTKINAVQPGADLNGLVDPSFATAAVGRLGKYPSQ
jgi:NitT/TauT family transport system substrate-binding protein